MALMANAKFPTFPTTSTISPMKAAISAFSSGLCFRDFDLESKIPGLSIGVGSVDDQTVLCASLTRVSFHVRRFALILVHSSRCFSNFGSIENNSSIMLSHA